jgi:glucokinase
VVDLGGTIIKAGLVRDGRLLVSSSMPARCEEGLAPQLGRIEKLLRELCNQASVALDQCQGVGVAFPGIIDSGGNRVVSVPRDKYDDAPRLDLPDWSRRALGLPMRLENDAHAALLGEWQFGAGAGCDDLVMITLGTGIGTSVLIRGRPLRGAHHQAGVLGGHFIVVPNGRPCPCGARGCVETECSSLAIPELARSDAQFAHSALAREPVLDFAALFRHAETGDALARRLRDRAMDWWGAVVVTLIHAFDPERVVIGGGIMRSAATILPHLQKFVDDNAWTPWGRVRLAGAALGNDASLLGLSVLFARELQYL